MSKKDYRKPAPDADAWQPLKQVAILMDGSTQWENNLYVVNRKTFEYPQAGPGKIAFHLSIRRQDRGHLLDWRHKQLIKNQLAGPEEEAVEIYPAEARLVDGANQFHLFGAFGLSVPFGFTERDVSETDGQGKCVQRPFTEKPVDLVICDGKRMDEVTEFYKRTGKFPDGADDYIKRRVERHCGEVKQGE